MQNVAQTIISQYANSPTILALIDGMNTSLDQSGNLNAFYRNIWNVDTAQGVGLDIWGRIVGVQRVLNIASGSYLGFAEPGDGSETPFNQAPFYSGAPTTSNFVLTDGAFRRLIYAKALANISDGSILSMNNILMTLFGSSGKCFVTDNGAMSMTLTFNFALSPVDFAIVSLSGILPKTSGVVVNIRQVF